LTRDSARAAILRSARKAAEESADNFITYSKAQTWSSSLPAWAAARERARRRSFHQVAKESSALTIGVVTRPFTFEGGRRLQAAEAAVAKMKEHAPLRSSPFPMTPVATGR